MKNITLVKIAAIGGLLTCTMGYATYFKINSNIKKEDFFKEGMKLVRTNSAAVYLLGEPIRDLSIRVGDRGKNYLFNESGKYEVPLKGNKQQGILHLYINKNEETQWQLHKAELEFANEPGKRLLIKNSDVGL